VRSNKQRFFSVVFSSLGLASAFLWPKVCYGNVFLFLCPLFYFQMRSIFFLRYRDGFYWGFLFFLFHTVAFLHYFFESTHTRIWCLVFFLFFIVYLASCSGVWFYCMGKLAQYSKIYFDIELVLLVVITYFYFVFISHCALFPLGVLKGYGLASPILPLVKDVRWLKMLPVMGSLGYQFFLILFQALFAGLLIRMRLLYGLLFVLVSFPFFYGWVVPIANNMKNYDLLEEVGYISLKKSSTTFPLDRAQDLDTQIDSYLSDKNKKKIIFTPEEAFPYMLNEHPDIINLFKKNSLKGGVVLLLGCHRKKEDKCLNTIALLSEVDRIQYYDKKELVPFVEYIPWPWSFLFSYQSLFYKKLPFSLQNKEGLSVNFIIKNISFVIVPYICSDIFFEKKCSFYSLNEKRRHAIVCFIGDQWSSYSYMRELMYYFAKLKSIELDVPLFYISYNKGVLINPDGCEFVLS
jgi:apolipoprotein N-acyltransferase